MAQKKICPKKFWVKKKISSVIFAGAARRAAPASMSILCVSEIISRPLQILEKNNLFGTLPLLVNAGSP